MGAIHITDPPNGIGVHGAVVGVDTVDRRSCRIEKRKREWLSLPVHHITERCIIHHSGRENAGPETLWCTLST